MSDPWWADSVDPGPPHLDAWDPRDIDDEADDRLDDYYAQPAHRDDIDRGKR